MYLPSLFSLLPLLLAATAVYSQDPVPPGLVAAPKAASLSPSFSYGGSGCNQNTLKYQITPEDNNISFFYPDLNAAIGPTVEITQNRKNCQAVLTVLYPEGYQFTFSSMSFEGSLDIGKNVSATHKVDFYFPGETGSMYHQIDWDGPVLQNYTVTANEMNITGPVLWSTCGGGASLSVNTQVRLWTLPASPNARGSITLDYGVFNWALGLKWRKCTV